MFTTFEGKQYIIQPLKNKKEIPINYETFTDIRHLVFPISIENGEKKIYIDINSFSLESVLNSLDKTLPPYTYYAFILYNICNVLNEMILAGFSPEKNEGVSHYEFFISGTGEIKIIDPILLSRETIRFIVDNETVKKLCNKLDISFSTSTTYRSIKNILLEKYGEDRLVKAKHKLFEFLSTHKNRLVNMKKAILKNRE